MPIPVVAVVGATIFFGGFGLGGLAKYLRKKILASKKKCIKSNEERYYGYFRCHFCKYTFSTSNELRVHELSEMHILKRIHHIDKASLKKKINHLQIQIKISAFLNICQIEISCINTALDGSKIYIRDFFELASRCAGMEIEYGSNYCLRKDDSFKITVRATDLKVAEGFPIILKVSINDSDSYHYKLIEPFARVSELRSHIKPFQSLLINRIPRTQDENDNTRCIIPKPHQQIIPDVFGAHHSKLKKDEPIYNVPKCETKLSISEGEKNKSQTLRPVSKNHVPHSSTQVQNEKERYVVPEPFKSSGRIVPEANTLHSTIQFDKPSSSDTQIVKKDEPTCNVSKEEKKLSSFGKENDDIRTLPKPLKYNVFEATRRMKIDPPPTTARLQIGLPIPTYYEYVYNSEYKLISSSENGKDVSQTLPPTLKNNLPHSRTQDQNKNDTLTNGKSKGTPRIARKEEKNEPTTQIAREFDIPKTTLNENEIPNVLQTLIENGFKTAGTSWPCYQTLTLHDLRKLICEEGKLQHNKDVLSKCNYIQRLRVIMWIEEYPKLEEISMYRRKNINVLKDKFSQDLVGIPLPGLSVEDISLSTADFITLTVKSHDVPIKFQRYDGKIELIEKAAVYVKLKNLESYSKFKCWKYKSDVEFRYNRIGIKMSHAALDNIGKFNWQEWLYPRRFEQNSNNTRIRLFFNKAIAKDELQIQAINNIVQNRAFPAPYILFGPPGTGKTATLVEAIVQIWRTMIASRICVCASSNTAADVIALRLLKYVPVKDIIRVYALSRNGDEIPLKLREICNYDGKAKEVFFPRLDELRFKRRIVIMTSVTAGRFVSSGITFNYVFMDEAGHALETDVLIPISGFLTNSRCSLVLSGDPKQLGPVVKSPYASALGFDMSLLERLMTQCDIYKRDPHSGKYDPRVITMLVNNYRSHENILHIPNKRFYNNELQAKAPEEMVSSLCHWKGLPSKGFPIIFHVAKGEEDRKKNSRSCFNLSEVNVVEQYVRSLFNSKDIKLEQNEIGIVSPYREQIEKIRHRLLRSWPKINVDSVESFQGQEKKVIIISTVRSRALGFLKNEKRFNVAITRAIALLIVIGNPDVLQRDPHWRAFINYCAENRSFVDKPAFSDT